MGSPLALVFDEFTRLVNRIQSLDGMQRYMRFTPGVKYYFMVVCAISSQNNSCRARYRAAGDGACWCAACIMMECDHCRRDILVMAAMRLCAAQVHLLCSYGCICVRIGVGLWTAGIGESQGGDSGGAAEPA